MTITTQNKHMKTRQNWGDYAKFIGIFLVLLGHIPFSKHGITNWIYSFHMPLFFILSGYFEKTDRKSIKETITHNARTILIPYISFYIIGYIFWLVSNYIVSDGELTLSAMVVKPALGFLLGEWYDTPFSTSINGVLWFLPALFFCKLLFRVAAIASDYKPQRLVLISIFVILLVYAMILLDIQLYLSLDSALMALPFFVFGYILKGTNASMIGLPKYKLFALSALCLIIGTLVFLWNYRSDIADFNYGKNIVAFYITGIAGSLSVIFFTAIFNHKRNNILLYIGVNTLTIFALHGLINPIVGDFYFDYIFKKPREMGFSPIEGLIDGLTLLAISAILTIPINKYAPFILGIRKNKEETVPK